MRVQGGLKMKHGDLFREMQQLELLDDITTQQYQGNLSKEVKGLLRWELIKSFLEKVGPNYIPPNVDKCLGWTENSKAVIPTFSTYSKWEVVNTFKKEKIIVLDNKVPSAVTVKRKAQEKQQINKAPKRICLPVQSSPQGFTWKRNSCPFDSILTILRSSYTKDRTLWDTFIKAQNHYLTYIDQIFRNATHTTASWDSARDEIRQYLVENGHTSHHLSLTEYSSAQRIAELLCTTEGPSAGTLKLCVVCQTALFDYTDGVEFVIAQPSTSDTFQARWDEWFSTSYNLHCNTCQQIQQIQHIKLVHYPPGLICFNIYEVPLSWTVGIQLVDSGGTFHPYRLCGITYFDGEHFTSRIKEANGNIWYINNLDSQQEQPPINFSFVTHDSTMRPYSA